MLLDIRAAFDEMVTELEWMDAGTRARAHRKLYAMRPFVGFPEWISDPQKLDKFYKGVSENKYLINTANIFHELYLYIIYRPK